MQYNNPTGYAPKVFDAVFTICTQNNLNSTDSGKNLIAYKIQCINQMQQFAGFVASYDTMNVNATKNIICKTQTIYQRIHK